MERMGKEEGEERERRVKEEGKNEKGTRREMQGREGRRKVEPRGRSEGFTLKGSIGDLSPSG